MFQLIDQVRNRLQEALPGSTAQNKMIPALENERILRFKHEGEPKRGAVLVLFYKDQDNWRFPLIQRPEYDGAHSGQISLPGGKLEDGDKDLIHTAIRETYEEIGVPVDQINVLGTLSEFFVHASNHLVLPVVGFTDKMPTFKPDMNEVSEIITPSISDLTDISNVKTKQVITSQGFRLNAPYYDLCGKIVWGATAMMLSELVEILDELKS